MHFNPSLKTRMPARSLRAYLKSADELAPLSAHAERLVAFQHAFVQTAPEHLTRMSQVANYKLGVVVIVTANGAVGAKLRQLAPRLLDQFSKLNSEITEIRVKVQASKTLPNLAPKKRARLTAAAMQSLERLSATLDKDSELKHSLDAMLRKQ